MVCAEHCKAHLDMTVETAKFDIGILLVQFWCTHKGKPQGWPSLLFVALGIQFDGFVPFSLSFFQWFFVGFSCHVKNWRSVFSLHCSCFFQGQSAIEFVPVNDGSFQFPLPEFITEEGRSSSLVYFKFEAKISRGFVFWFQCKRIENAQADRDEQLAGTCTIADFIVRVYTSVCMIQTNTIWTAGEAHEPHENVLRFAKCLDPTAVLTECFMQQNTSPSQQIN